MIVSAFALASQTSYLRTVKLFVAIFNDEI